MKTDLFQFYGLLAPSKSCFLVVAPCSLLGLLIARQRLQVIIIVPGYAGGFGQWLLTLALFQLTS